MTMENVFSPVRTISWPSCVFAFEGLLKSISAKNASADAATSNVFSYSTGPSGAFCFLNNPNIATSRSIPSDIVAANICPDVNAGAVPYSLEHMEHGPEIKKHISGYDSNPRRGRARV